MLITPNVPKSSKKVTIATALIAVVVMASCGYVIINEIAKVAALDIPDNGVAFIIEGKKVIDHQMFPPLPFLTEKVCLYQFNSSYGDYGWLEVPDFVYGNYSVGDLYPNAWVVYH